jgi:hypothetical protein
MKSNYLARSSLASLSIRGTVRAFSAVVVLFGGLVFGRQSVVIVDGIGGEQSFIESIEATAVIWEQAARAAGHSVVRVSPTKQADAVSQVDRLKDALEKVVQPDDGASDVLWLVLTGHGSAQGKSAKFAMDGEDLSVEMLSAMLDKIRCPVIVVAGFSCGGAFVKPLSHADRLIVAATRSGEEENWTRFPKLFAEAITGFAADADADGQVSLYEAWRHSALQVVAFYRDQGRMLTEHSVLEDTGDGKPIGVDAIKTPEKSDDKKTRKNRAEGDAGAKARQWHFLPSQTEAALTPSERAQREEIEHSIKLLREEKMRRLPEDYQAEIEGLLLKLAAIYAGVHARLQK